jgi:hypothetical protein
MHRRRLSWSLLPWLLFVPWLAVWVPIFESLTAQGQTPIDFLAYRRAADALDRGESPYLEPDESRRIWRAFHQLEVDVQEAATRGEGGAKLREILARAQQPGPYLYPPTLALLVAQLQIGARTFGIVLLAAIFGFGWLWLRSAGAGGAWLLLVMLSWDVLASLSGGNVELLLLFGALAAARLLWDRRWLAAGPIIALVVLVKPFYALFFVAFGALQLAREREARLTELRSLASAASAALVLVALEVARWGDPLRSEALDYLVHALEYQWYVLPLSEQTPMSAWNRAPMQGLMSAGLPASTAQALAIGLWLALTALTAWRAWGVRLPFTLAFALAFVLLYLGRPVGWGLIYLELVVLVALWPHASRWQRIGLIGGAAALMISHWWALALTIRGAGVPLFTLQGAAWPWETWLVLPACWLLLTWVTARGGTTAEPDGGRPV